MKIILLLLLSAHGLIGMNMFRGDIQQSEPVQARLISEVESIEPGALFTVGLLLEIEKGWHTYWLNPGDSGLPTTIEWDLPSCFVPGDIEWPYPYRLGTETIVNFGYEAEVLLITEIKASQMIKPGERIRISARVDWLVCKEECLPGQADLTLILPVKNGASVDSHWAIKFVEARRKLPKSLMDWGIRASTDGDHVTICISSPSWFESEITDLHFFPEQMELFDYAKPQIFRKTEEGYSIQVELSKLVQKIPSELQGVLVSDKSWSRVPENRALRVVVPFT
jgi:DsbC/DsbD-like thiol-disulfide interchange protein